MSPIEILVHAAVLHVYVTVGAEQFAILIEDDLIDNVAVYCYDNDIEYPGDPAVIKAMQTIPTVG